MGGCFEEADLWPSLLAGAYFGYGFAFVADAPGPGEWRSRGSLDLARKVVRLRPEDTKTGRSRVVPLTDRVVAAISLLPTPIGREPGD